MLKSIVLSTGAFGIFFVIHLIVFHYFPVKRKFRTMMVIAAFSLGLYTLGFIFGSDFFASLEEKKVFNIANPLNALFLYLSGYYIYFYFIVFAYRSITARFMVEIDWHAKKVVSPSELRKSFSFKKKLETEIEDMIDIGRFEKKGEFYRNSPKGRFHGETIEMLKKFLRLEEKR